MVGFAQFDENLQAPGLEQIQRLGPGFVSTVEQLRDAVQFGQHAAGAGQQAGAVIGQAHAVGVALKQQHTEASLQFGNRTGHYRLCPEQGFRGFGYTAVVGHPDKGAHVHQAGQLTRLHGGRLFDWAIRWDYACLTDELAINKTHTCNKLMHYSGAAAGCDPLANC